MKRSWIVVGLALCAANLGAQAPGPKPMPRPPGDPLGLCLFPPELVMAHQRDIGLQDAQRTKLIAEMSQSQAKFTEVQWTLSGEQQRLEQLLKGTTVDETAVLKQVDRILSLEQDLKRTQMTLMVRVKNTLTPQQQATLAEFRGKRPMMPDGGPTGPPPQGGQKMNPGFPPPPAPECG